MTGRGTTEVQMIASSAAADGQHGIGPLETAYIVGPDRDGRWVAVEIHGLGGGLFRTKEAAEDYAAFETSHRPGAVRRSEASIELTI